MVIWAFRPASALMTATSRSAVAVMRWLLLVALGAQLAGLALAVGLHAVVDRLGVGLRQVGALDADVDHLDAQVLGLGVHPAR